MRAFLARDEKGTVQKGWILGADASPRIRREQLTKDTRIDEVSVEEVLCGAKASSKADIPAAEKVEIKRTKSY